jgi:hypothetical protein
MGITQLAEKDLIKLIDSCNCKWKREWRIEPSQETPSGRKQYFGKIDIVVLSGEKSENPFAAFEIHHSGWTEQAKKNILNLLKFRNDYIKKARYPPVLLVVVIVIKKPDYDKYGKEMLKYYWNVYKNVCDAFKLFGTRCGKNFELWVYVNRKFRKLEENGKIGQVITREKLNEKLSKYG